MKRLFSITLVAMLLFPAAIFSQNVKQVVLDNGLTVILDENHDKPEAFGMVVVKAGAKDDPADATGMAHYQEHMLFKGTTQLGTTNWELEKPHIDRIFELYDELGKTKDQAQRDTIQKRINEESLWAQKFAIPNELSGLINEMGGTSMNAGTGADYTVFYNKFPSNQIVRWLDLYAHRFQNPVFRSFQAELEVVYEEKNLYNDMFQTRILEEFQKHFYKNHPYGQQTVIGTVDDLKNPSLTKMYQFFKTYYVPNNMALIISGDINPDEIIPIVKEKFGVWERAVLPQKRTWEEQPFNGREFYEAKLTPIKMAILGFRSPSSKDKDQLVMDVVTRLMNNSYSTGVFDKLSIDGKLLGAMAIQIDNVDYGALGILIIPKIIGQKLESAEALVLAEIEKLKKGDFDETMLQSIKQEMYREHVTSMENNESRAMLISDAFVTGKTVDEALDYPNRVKAITKQDVVDLANRVLGPNFVAFYSKMGLPKKEKIEKPDYKPLENVNSGKRSGYAQRFEKLSVSEPSMKPVDFDKDIERLRLANGTEIMRMDNPINDVFSFTIEYKVGKIAMPILDFLSESMEMCGADSLSVGQLKQEFAKIGTSFSIRSDDNITYVEVQGLDSGLERTVELLGRLIRDPQLEQEKIATIIDSDRTNRKMERSEPDNVASALCHYGLYGQKSHFIDRLTANQVKSLKATEITDAFKLASTYEAKIGYTGKASIGEFEKLVNEFIPMAEKPLTDPNPLDRVAQVYTENTVLFVNKPKARQSKMFFFINGESYTPDDEVVMEAFNDYFGGGFNGLVLQEIREFRSLAYSAGANFSLPEQLGSPLNFLGYVGTQSDKTTTAMETFCGLVRNMPQKSERIGMIRSYLELSAQTKRPGMRATAFKVEAWKLRGYTKDPILQKMPQYKALTWDMLMNFYESRVKNKPMVCMIVGDKKNIDMKQLAKYGKVVEIKEKQLFSK